MIISGCDNLDIPEIRTLWFSKLKWTICLRERRNFTYSMELLMQIWINSIQLVVMWHDSSLSFGRFGTIFLSLNYGHSMSGMYWHGGSCMTGCNPLGMILLLLFFSYVRHQALAFISWLIMHEIGTDLMLLWQFSQSFGLPLYVCDES